MTPVLFERGYLPWDRNAGEERLFLRILLIAMVVALLLGLLVPLFDVPLPDRDKVAKVPPRVAKFLLEKQRKKPQRKVEEKREEKKLDEKKPEEKKERTKEQNVAREKARNSGVFKGVDLSSLQSSSVLSKVRQGGALIAGGAQATRLGDDVIAAASTGSDGIDTSDYSRETGSGGELGEHVVSKAEADNPSLVAMKEEEFKRKSQPKKRDQENVLRVLDANKGRIYAIYNRALRSNPLLAGKLVLELTIEPSGKVSQCRVVASDLGDAKLEAKLMARIKMLDFGAEKVPVYSFRYPIEFLPS
ncbi:MAG: AgmX/PglI C-terminal domain-containing protein [Chromatiales bacterium]|nr:AgmX/PglI C-terminal domain-containing protein [Chromatiales bacterium]